MKRKPARIPEDIKLGAKLRLFYGAGHPSNRLIHIVAIVDGDQVVSKSWSRRRQSWVYQVEPLYAFELRAKPGKECLYRT